MNAYKPEFFGAVAPFDNPAAMGDFLRYKYDAFSAIFQEISKYAENIQSVAPVDNQPSSSETLSIEITTTADILDLLKKQMTSATIMGNIITATATA